jgi:hypothetical protein
VERVLCLRDLVEGGSLLPVVLVDVARRLGRTLPGLLETGLEISNRSFRGLSGAADLIDEPKSEIGLVVHVTCDASSASLSTPRPTVPSLCPMKS